MNTPSKRRVWPWIFGGLALLLVLIAGGLAAALLSAADSAQHGWHVIVNGDSWDGWNGWDELGLDVSPAHGVLALLGVGAALLVVLVVVPMALMLVLVLVGLGLAIALVAGFGSVALVLLVAGSPLWLFGLLLWLLLRRRSPPSPEHAARMGA